MAEQTAPMPAKLARAVTPAAANAPVATLVSEPTPEPKSGPKSQPRTEPGPQPRPESKSGPRSGPSPQPRPELRPKSEPRSQPRPEPSPQPRPGPESAHTSGAVPDRPSSTNPPLAAVSFVSGLIGLLVANLLLGPLAIITGLVALRTPARRGRAALGIVLGLADLGVFLLLAAHAGAHHGMLSWNFLSH